MVIRKIIANSSQKNYNKFLTHPYLGKFKKCIKTIRLYIYFFQENAKYFWQSQRTHKTGILKLA